MRRPSRRRSSASRRASPASASSSSGSPSCPGTRRACSQVASDEGWQTWTEVGHFADSGPDDRHFMLDAINGELTLGPGRARRPTARSATTAASRRRARCCASRSTAPAAAAAATSPAARCACCGRRSRTSTGSRTGIRRAAAIDAETIEEAKDRGPILLRTGNRAVTIEDYEVLAQRGGAGDRPGARCRRRRRRGRRLGARARRAGGGGRRRPAAVRAARAERRVGARRSRRTSTSGG